MGGQVFILEVLEYKSAMIIYMNVCMCKNTRYRSQFELIFMKLTWLVRLHPWVNPIVFGNNWPDRTIDIGKYAGQTSFSD